MSYYGSEIRRVAHDAAEAAVKRERTDAARAERLRTRLEQMIGSIPDEHQTADEIGKYGLQKLGQDLPKNGNHADALEYYLAGCASRVNDATRGRGMDSRDTPDFIRRYLLGSAA